MMKYDYLKLNIKNSIPRRAWGYYIDTKENRRLKKLRSVEPRHDNYSLKPFDQHKTIFIHIPKAAGISISTSLFGCLGGGHAKLRNYKAVYKEEIEKYYLFTFVRNPWDRLYSAYMFLAQSGFNYNDILIRDEIVSKYDSFEDFVMQFLDQRNIYKIIHLIPQTDYLLEDDSIQTVNYIGRYETINEDYDRVCNQLGIERKNLSKINITKSKNDYREAYTDSMIEKVHSLYSKDIKTLGYSFEK